jgi:hypothetical protein
VAIVVRAVCGGAARPRYVAEQRHDRQRSRPMPPARARRRSWLTRLGTEMWDHVRRWAPCLALVYLCLSVLAVGVLWWIDREGPPSAALPSQPSGGGIVSVRPQGDPTRSDRSAAVVPIGERSGRTTGREGSEGQVRPDPADGRHGRRPPAVPAGRHPARSVLPHPVHSERTSPPDRDRPGRPGTPIRRPIPRPHPPTTAGPSTTTGTTAGTTTTTTGTTSPTGTTTTTTGPAPSTERRSRR